MATTTVPKDRVYVAPSHIHGKGLFAAVDLDCGTLIGRYEGPEVTVDDTYVLWIDYGEESEHGWTGIDGRNDMRFLNHASNPNAEMDGCDCYAIEDIAAGQEITIDYGWDDPGDDPDAGQSATVNDA